MRGGRRGGEKLYHRLLDSYVKGLSGSHLTPATALKRGFFSSQIIAILAAILFPVFAKAREKARQSSCLNNVKQLGLAYLQYAQDYDERTPYIAITVPANSYTLPNGTVATQTALLWHTAIYPYVKNVQVYNCPSETFAFTGQYTGDGSYGLNTRAAGIAMGTAVAPAENMILAEADGGDAYSLDGDNAGANDEMIGSASFPSMPRHNAGLNNVFLDGHAKWMQGTAIPSYANAVNSRYWSPAYTGSNP